MSELQFSDWVDFVRGLGDPPGRRHMMGLLERDDRQRREVELLRLTAQTLAEDAADQPPAAALAAVRALFDVAHRGAEYSEVPLQLLRRQENAPSVGLRTAATQATRLLYACGPWELDLHTETPSETIELILVGRLLRPDGPEGRGPRMPVFLLADGEIAQSTLSGEFGEFHLESVAEGRLTLRLLPQEGTRIDVPITRRDLFSALDLS